MSKNLENSISQFAKQLLGETISVGNALDNVRFAEKSKQLAKKHEWLFHCTRVDALFSILENRELWLSNLKIVNDKEEVGRVDVPEYEKTYYVCSFTYDTEIPIDHWEEYGGMNDGVLIGIKPEWIKREAVFMSGDNQKSEKTILKNEKEAVCYKVNQQRERRLINPFYINEFGFYQVIYDNELVKNIKGDCSIKLDKQVVNGVSLTPAVAGIIKSTKGVCQRWGMAPYEKEWSTEKEVRLKIGIQQLEIFTNGYEVHDGMIMRDVFFPKIAVPITENAFNEIKIKFSPKFINKEEYLKKLENLLPESKIEIL